MEYGIKQFSDDMFMSAALFEGKYIGKRAKIYLENQSYEHSPIGFISKAIDFTTDGCVGSIEFIQDNQAKVIDLMGIKWIEPIEAAEVSKQF